MSYRQSSYDPTAHDRPGPPLRPFNWVQWTGVAMVVLGLAIDIAYFAAKAGWIPRVTPSPSVGIAPIIVGQMMIQSRTAPAPAVDDALQRARNRRALALTVAACALILGAAAVIQFSGA